MLAFKRVIRAVPMVGILAEYPEAESKAEAEPDVNLWADSVGDALTQLGLVLTLAIALHVGLGLLSGLTVALK